MYKYLGTNFIFTRCRITTSFALCNFLFMSFISFFKKSTSHALFWALSVSWVPCGFTFSIVVDWVLMWDFDVIRIGVCVFYSFNPSAFRTSFIQPCNQVGFILSWRKTLPPQNVMEIRYREVIRVLPRVLSQISWSVDKTVILLHPSVKSVTYGNTLFCTVVHRSFQFSQQVELYPKKCTVLHFSSWWIHSPNLLNFHC